MSAALHASMPFEIPDISQADIELFHETHFNADVLGLLESQFLRPDLSKHAGTQYDTYEDTYEDAEDYDDGLGYYPDGVKRTLTDEQIAIFRHSEIEALRRAQTNASKSEKLDDAESTVKYLDKEKGEPLISSDVTDAGEGSEEGEIEAEKPVLTKAEIRRQKKLRARQKKRENQKFQPEKKPDLRKRTWDVVESGMDSLHYDELELSQDHTSTSAVKRKQISYDD
ncbi:hypothetical protein GGS21DRAFT_360287 [Xylaria nigripes]|nr:hypothetical protein GGS21DRAFT_360287 [Xylaria nigripes]